jgi:protein involved in ribonucleotide reduction
MGMISACFCVFEKQGTPNDVANVENNLGNQINYKNGLKV